MHLWETISQMGSECKTCSDQSEVLRFIYSQRLCCGSAWEVNMLIRVGTKLFKQVRTVFPCSVFVDVYVHWYSLCGTDRATQCWQESVLLSTLSPGHFWITLKPSSSFYKFTFHDIFGFVFFWIHTWMMAFNLFLFQFTLFHYFIKLKHL